MKRFKSYCWNVNFKETDDELLVKLYNDCIIHNENTIKEINMELVYINNNISNILNHIICNIIGLIILIKLIPISLLFCGLIIIILSFMMVYYFFRKKYLNEILPTFEDDNDFNEYMISEIKIKTIQKKYYSC